MLEKVDARNGEETAFAGVEERAPGSIGERFGEGMAARIPFCLLGVPRRPPACDAPWRRGEGAGGGPSSAISSSCFFRLALSSWTNSLAMTLNSISAPLKASQFEAMS